MIGAARSPSRPCAPEGSVPMKAMLDVDVTPPLRRVLAVACLGLALGACSRELSAQSASAHEPADPPRLAATEPAAAAASAETLVRGLPDFSSLVDRYGPAVVNV